jgi:pimeloyl-ACP methyl ester carboxylesterase
LKKDINNGLSIYDYGGDSIPLIFVHGFPLDSRMWNEQIFFFKNKFRVVTYDVRGLGNSFMKSNQFTMETNADDLIDILDYLKIKKANVCGLSMGGYITLRAVIKDPKRFNTIILADTKAERDDNKGLISRSNVVSQVQAGKREEFFKTFLQKLLNKKNYKDDKIKKFLYKIMSEQCDEGICSTMIALATRINVIDELSEIDLPALIIVGKDDELTPLYNSKSMHNALKNSSLIIVPNSGHMSNLENPEYFNYAVYEFLKKHS